MKRIFLIGLVVLSTSVAQASEMRTFLLSCAYGAGIGALAGVTALAFSETPNSNLSYITRGASIGLYAGMGIGYYLITNPEHERRGYTEPVTLNDSEMDFYSVQRQANEVQTVASNEISLPSMPILAVVPSGTRENLSADLFVGYRFNIP